MADGGAWRDLPFNQQQQILSAPADFVADVYGLQNLCYGVSTALYIGCKSLNQRGKIIEGGLGCRMCGGVDTLSPLTINGFNLLGVLDGMANPFSAQRDGINIGEAAAAFVMTREAGFGELAAAGLP